MTGSLEIHVKLNLEVGSPFARARERQLLFCQQVDIRIIANLKGDIAIGKIFLLPLCDMCLVLSVLRIA